MKKIYFLLFALFFSTFLISQNNILIIDYNNAFTSDQNNNASRIYNRLVATQASVTRIGSIPASISNVTYNQVWLFGNMGAPVASNLNPIINFMNGGGGVYVQSEVSCCNTQADYLDALINATVITGGSISHNTTYSNPYQYTPNPNTICSSTGSWSHYGNAVRPFIGVAAQNILFQITTTCSNLGVNNAGVQFRSCDLISGQGALIGTGDINLFALNANCAGNSALNGNPNNNVVIDHIANLFPALRNCSFGSPTGSATWTNPSPICAAAGSINLSSLVTGTGGGTWSGTGVSGSTFNPASGTQSVTYTVGTSPCTQSQTHTITVRPDVNPAWTNPSPICAAAGSINLNSLITGTTGGSWSGTGVSGSTFNPASGSQSVTYTVGTAPCQETSTQTITVRPDVNPAWTNPGPLCAAAGGTVTLMPAQAGGTWSGTGVTSGGVFSLSAGTQSITYTIGTAPCQETSTQTITVRPDVNPAWTNPSPICATAGSINLNSLITGTTGGTWSGTGVSGSSFNPASGSQSVTYTVGTAPCQETSTQTITVTPSDNPAWTNPSPICAAAGSINLNSLITGTTGGSWSGTGVSGSSFNPASGTQSVTYTVGTAPCTQSQTHTITVRPDVNPAWTNPSPICAAAGSINLNSLITGTTGGTWSGTGVSGSSFNPASGTQSVTYTVGTAPCQETSTQTITIVPDVNPAWSNPSPICAAAGSINLSSLVTGTGGGTWSGTGVSGSSFNPNSGTQSVTYTVGTAPCVETQTHTITVIPDVDPSWTNPSPICAASGSINLNNLITGNTGGSWSGTGVTGNMFDPSFGSQSVTYTVGTAPCQETSTQTITVATVSAAWTNPTPICEGDAPINLSALVTGSAGGSFSGTGVTANSLNPSGLGGTSVIVTYTVGTAPCTETQAHTIVINNDDDASFSFPQSSYCITGNNPTPTVTGTSGGTFTISAPGSINATTGEINLVASGVGSFSVIYNTAAAGNPCPVSDTVTITITTGQTAGFSYDNAQYCVYDNAPILTLNGGATAGTFSATPTGLSINNAGAVTLATSSPGIYTVYNNVPAANGCAPAIDSTTIEILPLDTAAFSYSANAYCLADPNPSATITGTPGGTFTISPTSGVINATTGEIDINASGAGTYTIYYNTASAGNPCPVIDSVTITLMPQNFIVPNSIPNFCLGDSTALTASASGNGTITWYSDVTGTTVIGTGSPFYPPVTAAGTYTYYVNEAGTCPSPMDSVTFTVQYVDAQASANPSVGPMPLVVNFSNSSTGATNYFWDFANGNLDSTFAPTQTYTEPGTYTVTLVVTDGLCWDSTTIVIEVFNESSLTIPNVFTPNGDGHNDVFTVDGENLKSVEGEIYNRWGQKMFAWGNVNGYWDGKTLAGADAPDGTYFFIIKAEGIDGQQFFEKGTLSLIR